MSFNKENALGVYHRNDFPPFVQYNLLFYHFGITYSTLSQIFISYWLRLLSLFNPLMHRARTQTQIAHIVRVCHI